MLGTIRAMENNPSGVITIDKDSEIPTAKIPDVPEKQILIDTQYIHVSDGFLESIGLDANSLKNSDSWSKYRIENSNDPNYFVIDKLVADLIQNAIEENPDCHVVTQPSLYIKDGKPGSIEIVTEEYHITQPDTSIPDSKHESLYRRYDLNAIKAGTFINYTPQITDENSIRLDLDITVKDFVKSIKFHPGEDPNLFVETVFGKSSEILIPQDKTLLILGSKVTQTAISESKVPLLGDLPLIGKTFSNRSKITDIYIPIVIIKPAIVSLDEVRIGSPKALN